MATGINLCLPDVHMPQLLEIACHAFVLAFRGTQLSSSICCKARRTKLSEFALSEFTYTQEAEDHAFAGELRFLKVWQG